MKVADLFCGCGGLSLGFKKAGFDIVCAIDNWDKAFNVYQKNSDHPSYLIDISDQIKVLDVLSSYKPDIIIGGPPCQDFSSAGKRDENLGRGDLTLVYSNLIETIKPLFFVMENVARITTTTIYKKAIAKFIDSGYGLTQITLDSSFCNVPQKRLRHFVIGGLNVPNDFLRSRLINNFSAHPLTVQEYLAQRLDTEHYYRHPRNYSRRAIYSTQEPSPTIRGVNRPIPKNYHFHPQDSTKTLEEVRPLTTLERSWIQTFPWDYKWEGTKTDLEQMVGNAVPVNLAYYVAYHLKQWMEDRAEENFKINNTKQLILELAN